MKRNSQLVTQYVENVSRQMLEEYQHLIRQYVRNRHGVYALYSNKKLYYVGLASNLRNRLTQHLRDRHGKSWNRFSVYLTISDGHMKELETLTLRIMRPPGNTQQGRFARAESLERRLRRDVRDEQLSDLDDLFGLAGRRRQRRALKKPADPQTGERRPVLAPYAKKRIDIRRRYKGKFVRARVLKGGEISLRGKRYKSPSLAAEQITHHHTNGWKFWTYERAPGDWVPLSVLRQR